jgi:hypothetical protein
MTLSGAARGQRFGDNDVVYEINPSGTWAVARVAHRAAE